MSATKEQNYDAIEAGMRKYELTLGELTHLYNMGYGTGHHHTVESQYSHIYREDLKTHQQDVVLEILNELYEVNKTLVVTGNKYESSLHEDKQINQMI